MNYKTIHNFLEKEKFLKVKNIITNQEFPWFYKGVNTEIKGGFFMHSFFNENRINSRFYYECLTNIFEKIKPRALLEVRANLLLSSLFYNEKSRWHIDFYHENYTAVFYLNTTEGGTELKNNDKVEFIKAEENKILIMKGNVEHRAILSPDIEKRYIINLNYFGEKNEFDT